MNQAGKVAKEAAGAEKNWQTNPIMELVTMSAVRAVRGPHRQAMYRQEWKSTDH